MFKATRIETDEQFIHVARYIHLNPLTSFIIKTSVELKKYPWTSYAAYNGNIISAFLTTTELLEFFPTLKKLQEFTFNQVDYQRDIHKIKHLVTD